MMNSETKRQSVPGTRLPAEYRFSVIIPVLDEQEHINSVIGHLRGLPGSESCEIIVVDGDPGAGTIGAIKEGRIVTITCEKGRGRQMNAGADVAKGEMLVFLHADTRLPDRAFEKIAQVLEDERYVAGAFDLSIDSNRLILKYIAARARLRSRLNRIPYGDQAIFMRKSYFEEIGRFKEIPIMEDIDLMRATGYSSCPTGSRLRPADGRRKAPFMRPPGIRCSWPCTTWGSALKSSPGFTGPTPVPNHSDIASGTRSLCCVRMFSWSVVRISHCVKRE
ncbi:MAG: TIGR04283 family arsenosugar biosynthesis glycosyltransferase [Planctomycetota bacterium]|jgi:rSAM/selenodomain-associated transferase 2